MTTARIYQRPKNAMQSGRARTDNWVLEFAPSEAKKADPLTGWAGSGDTRDQVRIGFPTQEAAVAYAERNGIDYRVIAPKEPTRKSVSYSDNFRFSRTQPWTH